MKPQGGIAKDSGGNKARMGSSRAGIAGTMGAGNGAVKEQHGAPAYTTEYIKGSIRPLGDESVQGWPPTLTPPACCMEGTCLRGRCV